MGRNREKEGNKVKIQKRIKERNSREW